jgi:hypothetical protein
VTQVIQAGKSSTTALTGSTEEEQFYVATAPPDSRSEQAVAAD